MARQSKTKKKNELIECEYCGEMYSVTYKHCPFCNEDGTGRWDDPDSREDEEYYDEPPAKGGRRLAGGGRPGRPRGEAPSVGKIIGWALSLALIIAAAGIVLSIFRPLLGLGGKRKEPKPENSSPAVSEPALSQTDQPTGEGQGDVTFTEDPPSQPSAEPGVVTPSVDLTAPTDFKLRQDDISFFSPGESYQMPVTLIPADAHGEILWKSSDPNVASVSESGLITAVSRGTVTVTATIQGVGERSCIVRCSFQGGAAPATTDQPTSDPGSSAGLVLSREDFTLSRAGESWRLTVSGTSSAVSWATTDANVATVSGDGTVTAVGSGTCRVTATVDGVTLKCIVRCSF